MKVLIVGLGSIAQKHIAALRKTGPVEIFALRSSRDSEDYDEVTNVYDYDEVKIVDPDFFLISNPTSKHATVIHELLKFKKPFFIEKPLFHQLGAFEKKVVQEIRKEEIITYTACNLRFLDSLNIIKKEINGARINEINVYGGSSLPSWRPGTDFRKSYSARKEMGGGVHLDLVHELDYLYWIFGAPVKANSILKSNSSLEIDAVDYANFLWEYDGFCANIILNYYRKDAKREMEIVTSDHTFTVNLLSNKIFKNGVEIYSSDQKITDTYLLQMEFFRNEVLSGNQMDFNTIEEANKILNLCLQD